MDTPLPARCYPARFMVVAVVLITPSGARLSGDGSAYTTAQRLDQPCTEAASFARGKRPSGAGVVSVDAGRAVFRDEQDVVRLDLAATATSMPGDPIGIPGTVSPFASGFSRSRRSMSAAGTCPSTK